MLKHELHSRKKELIALGERYGISNIRVFGSVVRGEETDDSDIDLLVDIEKGRSLLDFCGFRLDAVDMFKREIDMVEASSLHPLLKHTILHEAQPL